MTKIRVGDEFFKLGGLLKSDETPQDCSDWENDFGSSDGCDYPDQVDLRNRMSFVEDQSNIGSCTANAVAGAYEYLCNVVASQNGDNPGDISRLFIYYVARKYKNPNEQVHDRGSSITGAINALRLKGACLEETYPYDISMVNHTPPNEAFHEALDYKISHCWKISTNVDTFQSVLAKGYPIVVGVRLTKSFMQERGKGIIQPPPDGDEMASIHGLHAMLVAGYYKSHKCFVVRNSWGDQWGYGGYCFMSEDYVASTKFNLNENYAIRGLTDYDFTPDDDSAAFFELDEIDGNDDEEEPPEVEVLEGSDCEDEEEDDAEFDADDFFGKYAEAKRVFDKFDVDESGKMNVDELERALKMNGMFISAGTMEEIMEQCDCDGSGEICFKEYLQILGFEDPNDDKEEEEDEEDGNEEDEEDDEEYIEEEGKDDEDEEEVEEDDENENGGEEEEGDRETEEEEVDNENEEED